MKFLFQNFEIERTQYREEALVSCDVFLDNNYCGNLVLSVDEFKSFVAQIEKKPEAKVKLDYGEERAEILELLAEEKK